MSQATSGTQPTEGTEREDQIRERLAARAKALGVLPLARKLGVTRGGLQSFLIGRERRGTAVLVIAAFDAHGEDL